MHALLARTLLPAALCAGTALWLPAQAQGGSDDWDLAATVYLWGAGIQGETGGGAQVDVGFDTLIRNLNMAFMGAFEARRSKWSAGVDLVYLNVGANDSGTVPLRHASGAAVDLDVAASVETKGWVLNLQGGYNLVQCRPGKRRCHPRGTLSGPGPGLQFGAGGRSIRGPAGYRGVAGRLGRHPGGPGPVLLGPALVPSLPSRCGDGRLRSDLASGRRRDAYGFDWGEVSLVYRHMAWDFGSGEPLDHIDFSGPLLAATWRF